MKKFALAAVLFLSPLSALAASHHFTCADTLNLANGVSCTSTDTFTFPSNGFWSDNQTTPYFNLPNSSSYWVTFTYSGTGSLGVFSGALNAGSNPAPSVQSASVSELPLTAGTDSLSQNVLILDARTILGNTFVGSLSSICIDDDGTSCAPGGGGTPPTPDPSTLPDEGYTLWSLGTYYAARITMTVLMVAILLGVAFRFLRSETR